MANGKPRPILITIIAILEFIAGILAVLAGIALMVGLASTGDADLGALGAYGGVVVIIAGIIALIIAGGFWNGWKIMWYLGMLFSILYIVLSIYGMVVSGFAGIGLSAIIPIIINLIIIFYLTRTKVKEFFGF